ncbi:hypothetical protein BA763_06680 [Burkholderia cenocepacia]|nr:hypothetical protein BA763_06680 [Burkholderia cenocepacia]
MTLHVTTVMPMHERRRGNECVPLGPPIRYMESCASLRDRSINRQHATRELRQDMPVKPCPQKRALSRVPALDLQDACLQLHDRACRDKKRGGVDG